MKDVETEILLVKIYDHDGLGPNDLLGEMEINIASIALKGPHEEARQVQKRTSNLHISFRI